MEHAYPPNLIGLAIQPVLSTIRRIFVEWMPYPDLRMMSTARHTSMRVESIHPGLLAGYNQCAAEPFMTSPSLFKSNSRPYFTRHESLSRRWVSRRRSRGGVRQSVGAHKGIRTQTGPS
jgi:hypothetical protein